MDLESSGQLSFLSSHHFCGIFFLVFLLKCIVFVSVPLILNRSICYVVLFLQLMHFHNVPTVAVLSILMNNKKKKNANCFMVCCKQVLKNTLFESFGIIFLSFNTAHLAVYKPAL